MAVSFGLLVSPSANAAGAATDEHIERVLNRVPPAIVIEGEPATYSTLPERMAALRVPGVSIAVIHDGRLEWARGFGVTKVGGSPVTPDTLFQAASISKPVTALAVMRLVDAGKVNLDTNVNEYLRSWKIPKGELTAKQAVTLRELLSHTAGITVGGFGGYSTGQALPTLLQILDGKPPANNAPIRVDTVPDTKWRYAGGGYVILRQILEDVSGLPFAELMQNTVLAPIGMERSTFEQPLPPGQLSTAAAPHDREGHAVKEGAHTYPELAPDGLWSTPSDLARFAIMVQQSLAGKPNSLLSAPTARLMLTARLNHFGLGPVVGDDPQHPWFTHNGGNYGFPSIFVAYNRGDGAVVMSSGQNGFELEIDILRSIAQEYDWPNFKPIKHAVVSLERSTLDGYVGAYQITPDEFAVVTRDGGRLSIQTSSEGRQPLFPISAHEFVLKAGSLNPLFNRYDDVKITFKTDSEGKAIELTFMQGGAAPQDAAKRMGEVAAQAVKEKMAAITKRFAGQLAAAGEERALRLLIGDLSTGRVDDRLVTPQFADELRSLTALNQQVLTRLGPVVSTSFKRVAPTGVDTYHVVFKHGECDVDIWLKDDGKIQYAHYFPE